MLITYVIPAYNASGTVGHTLDSIFNPPLPSSWQIEVVVVDDGSSDGDRLRTVVSNYPDINLIRHPENRGMCAGRNSGIAASHGDIVTVLDADDTLVPKWPEVLEKILRDWPDSTSVCYAACRNPAGLPTVQHPEYCGFLTLTDFLNERHSGEYLPLFRGDYIRKKPYVDLKMRKSCGTVSYINFMLDGPFWISNLVLRIYNDSRTGSVSHGWATPDKAKETVRCYHILFERYGDLYRREAPKIYRTKLLRFAVYLRLAGHAGAWAAWRKGASFRAPKETIGAALILAVGARLGARIAAAAKKIGLVRRYG